MNTIVYDAGALIAAENGVERMWALHKQALARAIEPVIPATVLAEVWRGGGSRQHRLNQFIQSCRIDDLNDTTARATGTLLATAPPHGIVDASVVECALRRTSPCVTSNRDHLSDLAGARRLNIIDI